MIDVRTTSDVKLLRDVCQAYEKANQQLVDRLQSLTQRIAELEGVDAAQAALELPAIELPPAADQTAAAPAQQSQPARTRPPQNGHGPTPQPQLPRQIELVELLPEQCGCAVCGGTVEPMPGQYEESEEITLVERTIKLVVRRRQKYRCRCNGNVVTAPVPPKVIPGGRYSLDFAVAVAADKYADHLPLERQVARFERQGLVVSSATLWDQEEALARWLEASYEALWVEALAAPVVNADETGWRLWERDQKIRCPWAVWGVSTPRVCVYRLLSSKSTKAARAVLGTYSGIVVADGAEVYEKLLRDGPARYRLVNCWAHVVRRFRETVDQDPRSLVILKWISDLYDVDALVPGPFPGDQAAQQQRHALRQSRSREITDRIKKWAFEQGGLRRSDFGQALRYMIERWEKLTVFLDNPLVPLDNNAAERALRGVVVGRKNHYGSRSRRGTEVAAILYSLVETAKIRGEDPVPYLRRAAIAAIAEPGTVTLPG